MEWEEKNESDGRKARELLTYDLLQKFAALLSFFSNNTFIKITKRIKLEFL